MGHDSERPALIYLNSSGARQRALADAVGEAARLELAKSKKRKAGAEWARRRFPRICGWCLTWRPDRDSNAGPTA